MSDSAALPGGVSSDIRIVNEPSGPIVVKQALPKLKVAADWLSNPARAAIEVRALKVAGELLGADHVPRVLWERPDEHRFAMNLIDPALRNWKVDLLAGHVNFETAKAAGHLLGKLHAGSARRDDIKRAFSDITNFMELRIEPFFDRVGKQLPELADAVQAVVTQMRRRFSVLVHGDYSPKNILADAARVVILDFEVAHWGDPAFDVGFCISHLMLKAMRHEADKARLRAASLAFLDGYQEEFGSEVDDTHLVQMTACLMLARTDGASPVNYLTDLEVDAVRSQARTMLLAPPASLRAVLTYSDSSAKGSLP